MEAAYKASIDQLNQQEQQHRDKAISLANDIKNFKIKSQEGLREIERAGMSDAQVKADKQLEIDEKTTQMREMLRNGDYAKAAELGNKLTELSKSQAIDAQKSGDFSAKIIAQDAYTQSVDLTTQALEKQKQQEEAKAEEAKKLAADQLLASQELAKSMDALNTKLTGDQQILLKVDQTQLDEAYKFAQDFPKEINTTVNVQQNTVQARNQGGFIHAVKRFAFGGSVPGTGNSDTVPAMLTPGEFVLRKTAVQRLDPAFLQALNSGQLNTTSATKILGQYNLNLSNGQTTLPASVSTANKPLLEQFMAEMMDAKRVGMRGG
jgi:hypothetical protein